MDSSQNDSNDVENERKIELRTFLFLTVFLAPILSVMIVGGYGFIIWMVQIVYGPPTV